MIQSEFDEVSTDYKAFVDKFKPKKTTDDCYTPRNVYDTILKWAATRYGFDPSAAVRPFWPGGDYQREKYPDGCVVVDNPPFSILSQICRFYNANGVRYFLFAPALTLFSNRGESNYVVAGASVTYENGAVVSTSFITNLGEYLVESAPDLRDAIKVEDDKNRREKVKELPKYAYPDAVITAASINYLAVHHTPYRLKREDALFIRRLDAQEGTDKALFGGGVLIDRTCRRRTCRRASLGVINARTRDAEDAWKELCKMIVRIIIRSDGTPRGHSIALDYKRESRDTPRVANMGVEIVRELQQMTGAPVQEKAEVVACKK